jgi:hypothetical protein
MDAGSHPSTQSSLEDALAPSRDSTPPQPSYVAATYPDLLLQPAFVRPFLSLTALMLACFGIVRGMCSGGVPDNCDLLDSNLMVQQILASIAQVFLVVAISDLNFLWRGYGATLASRVIDHGCFSRHFELLRTIALHLIALIVCVLTSAILKDYSIRHGFGILRILVGIGLLIALLPPLVFLLVWKYSWHQRLKAALILALYLAFLFTALGMKALHVHHWTYSYVYLSLLYPPIYCEFSSAQFPHKSNRCVPGIKRFMILWCQLASMIAFGILVEGLCAYGNSNYFINVGNSTSSD